MTDTASPTADAAEEIPAPLQEFVERFGHTLESEGLPRNAGRIFGLLIVLGGPISFSELSERLQASRGSVSTNTRLLEQIGILVRTSLPGERQDYFRLADDPYGSFLTRLVERARRGAALAGDTRAELPAGWGEAGARLAALENFYDHLGTVAAGMITELGDGSSGPGTGRA